MTQILRQRHWDRSGPGDLSQDRVGLEGTPGEDDLVTGAGQGMHELAGDLGRPGPECHLAHVDADVLGDGRAHLLSAYRRVTVEPGEHPSDGLDDARQRPKGVLVGRQLHSVRTGNDALLVKGKPSHDVASGHILGHVILQSMLSELSHTPTTIRIPHPRRAHHSRKLRRITDSASRKGNSFPTYLLIHPIAP